jgi:hypothetical protein
MAVPPTPSATGGCKEPCDSLSVPASAVLARPTLSKLQNIAMAMPVCGHAALQQLKWLAGGTTEHGLTGNHVARQKIQPETV